MKIKVVLSVVCLFTATLPVVASTGSLWPDDAKQVNGSALFTDPVACKVGDLITIVVNLSTTATKDRTMSTAKDVSVNDSITSLVYPQSNGMWDWFRYRDLAPTFNWSAAQSFDGEGDISDSEKMSTTIQARVVDVMPNGSMKIEARRHYEVGKEKTLLVLTGFVRREDVSASNMVSSTKIADLQIQQTGDGPLSRSRRKGWLTTLYEFLCPF